MGKATLKTVKVCDDPGVEFSVMPKVSLEPCGHRVIIKPRNVDSVTKGGIVLVEQTKDMEKRATQIGTVVAIGAQAWKAFADGSRWCNEGDTVMYSRYSGADVPEDIKAQIDPTADRLVVVNDEDVLSIVR